MIFPVVVMFYYRKRCTKDTVFGLISDVYWEYTVETYYVLCPIELWDIFILSSAIETTLMSMNAYIILHKRTKLFGNSRLI